MGLCQVPLHELLPQENVGLEVPNKEELLRVLEQGMKSFLSILSPGVPGEEHEPATESTAWGLTLA